MKKLIGLGIISSFLYLGCSQPTTNTSRYMVASDSLFVTIVGYDTAGSLVQLAFDSASINLFCHTNLPVGTKLIIFRTTGVESVVVTPYQLTDTITIVQENFTTTISRSMIYGYLLIKIEESLVTDTLVSRIRNSVAAYPREDSFFNCDELFCSYWHIYPESDINRLQRDSLQNAIWIEPR